MERDLNKEIVQKVGKSSRFELSKMSISCRVNFCFIEAELVKREAILELRKSLTSKLG